MIGLPELEAQDVIAVLARLDEPAHGQVSDAKLSHLQIAACALHAALTST